MIEAWSPSDPSLQQRSHSDYQLEHGEENLDEFHGEESPPLNPFIENEATGVSDANSQPEGEEEDESHANDCVIVETLTNDRTNAKDRAINKFFLEYLIDFDTLFCAENIVNWIKKANRKQVEITSDTGSEKN